MIDGVIHTPLSVFTGEKGAVLRAMRRDDDGYNGFGEAYFSTVGQSEIKAWKKHTMMYCNLVVIEGEVKFNLYDDRQTSLTQGQNMSLLH